MEWFLINVLSPLLLPIFLIAIIGLICDIKPDVFIKIYIDIVQSILIAVFRGVWQILKICFDFLCRFITCVMQCFCSSMQGKTGSSSRCKPCGSSDKSTDSGGSVDDGKPAPGKKTPGRKPKTPKTEPT